MKNCTEEVARTSTKVRMTPSPPEALQIYPTFRARLVGRPRVEFGLRTRVGASVAHTTVGCVELL